MKTIKGLIMCDCGHLESEHSEHTSGYGTNSETGKTSCYKCCVKQDINYLQKHGKLTAYVSSDCKSVTSWPGETLAKIIGYHTVDFGYCKNQMSFNAEMSDGTKLVGRGPGPGMYCRLRRIKS